MIIFPAQILSSSEKQYFNQLPPGSGWVFNWTESAECPEV